MTDQIETLKKLQAIDAELYQLRRQQGEKPKELEQASARVAAQEARLKELEAKLKTLQLSQKDKEGELQTKEANVKKLQGQLFQVKTNKEYSAMQREIDTLKADNSLLEEAILQTLDAIEQAGKARQQQQGLVKEAQQQFAQGQERITRELAALEDRVAQLERNRNGLAPDIPPQTLATYERVLEIREGLALVPVMSESCGGCHRRLPPQVINQVSLKADLVTCENCNRILYFDEAHTKL
jgi:predicted  nucleic acid-binding Zn-ribbon protein